MRFFWISKISQKGVRSNTLIWTGPQSSPKISQCPGYKKYYTKQNKSIVHVIRSKRNVSFFPSFHCSITVETAFVLPLFLFFCIQMISVISLIHVHSALEASLHQEASRMALETYAYDMAGLDMESAAGTFIENTYLQSGVIDRAGKEYLDRSMIEGGSSGIHLVWTEEEDAQDTVNIILSYQVKPMIDLLGFSGFTMANHCRIKAWTGYRLEDEGQTEDDREELVYVTETGTVYHKSRNCTHLSLSIRAVNTESVNVLRNDNGEKYYPCENCGKNAGSSVFLTDQGNRYHTSLNCGGLKRTVYTIPISETGGRRPCSRCSATG